MRDNVRNVILFLWTILCVSTTIHLILIDVDRKIDITYGHSSMDTLFYLVLAKSLCVYIGLILLFFHRATIDIGPLRRNEIIFFTFTPHAWHHVHWALLVLLLPVTALHLYSWITINVGIMCLLFLELLLIGSLNFFVWVWPYMPLLPQTDLATFPFSWNRFLVKQRIWYRWIWILHGVFLVFLIMQYIRLYVLGIHMFSRQTLIQMNREMNTLGPSPLPFPPSNWNLFNQTVHTVVFLKIDPKYVTFDSSWVNMSSFVSLPLPFLNVAFNSKVVSSGVHKDAVDWITELAGIPVEWGSQRTTDETMEWDHVVSSCSFSSTPCATVVGSKSLIHSLGQIQGYQNLFSKDDQGRSSDHYRLHITQKQLEFRSQREVTSAPSIILLQLQATQTSVQISNLQDLLYTLPSGTIVLGWDYHHFFLYPSRFSTQNLSLYQMQSNLGLLYQQQLNCFEKTRELPSDCGTRCLDTQSDPLSFSPLDIATSLAFLLKKHPPFQSQGSVPWFIYDQITSYTPPSESAQTSLPYLRTLFNSRRYFLYSFWLEHGGSRGYVQANWEPSLQLAQDLFDHSGEDYEDMDRLQVINQIGVYLCEARYILSLLSWYRAILLNVSTVLFLILFYVVRCRFECMSSIDWRCCEPDVPQQSQQQHQDRKRVHMWNEDAFRQALATTFLFLIANLVVCVWSLYAVFVMAPCAFLFLYRVQIFPFLSRQTGWTWLWIGYYTSQNYVMNWRQVILYQVYLIHWSSFLMAVMLLVSSVNGFWIPWCFEIASISDSKISVSTKELFFIFYLVTWYYNLGSIMVWYQHPTFLEQNTNVNGNLDQLKMIYHVRFRHLEN